MRRKFARENRSFLKLAVMGCAVNGPDMTGQRTLPVP